ncbi:hypothetical protein EV652_101639 [Kribbella steppae]|uniref:Uncharacterized protein n=1 Tax=Kribbella steppae TaxID=2512223 RepID=A0A4R2HWC8_9ACTN|nr:hypothetical protein EV652_101639 [Kribbella steppae]
MWGIHCSDQRQESPSGSQRHSPSWTDELGGEGPVGYDGNHSAARRTAVPEVRNQNPRTLLISRPHDGTALSLGRP